MTTRFVTAPGGRRVALAEQGAGAPVLYLHDFIDVHGATGAWFEFHDRLAGRRRVIAPAHAGCNGSDEDEDATTIDDAVFHVRETLELLGLDRVAVIGTGIGGWIAAELAVRCPAAVERLVLIGAAGLYLPGEPIADLFFEVQPVNGEHTDAYRRMLFADPNAPLTLEWGPRGRLAPERDALRYRMFRFAHRFGFNPPYLHNRMLRRRLPFYKGPALVLWGEQDGLVPPSHGRAYAEGLPGARAKPFPDAGHSLHLERPAEAADEIIAFLAEGAR